MVVQAEVVDITADVPKASDIFLVDTNVWFWTAYSKASLSKSYKASYDAYLKKVLAAGSRLYVSGLSQCELMHVIEKTELQMFKPGLDLKDFRHNYAAQRASVVAEATAAWAVVRNMADTIEIRVNDELMDKTLLRFQAVPMDGYDLISTEAMFEHGIPQVISSDADFAAVPDIVLFTANLQVIQDATAQKKILLR